MKYLHLFNIFFLLIVSFLWGCFALQTNPIILIKTFQIIELIKFTYVISFTVVFWPVFYVEICDLIYTAFGGNGKAYSKFFSSMKKEIVITLCSALALMSIYWTDTVKYDFSGIDLAFVGAPFVLTAIYSIFQMMKIKIAGKPVRKPVLIIMLVIVLSFAILAFSYLQKNSAGQYKNYQAIWFQVTILFVSFYFYINTSYQLYFLKEGKIELSKFKLNFFTKVIVSKERVFENLEESIEESNKKTQIAKAKYSAKLRKKK